MAVNIPGVSIIATKMASGNVRLVLQNTLDGLNPFGGIVGCVVIPSADFTSFNTTVNGGAAGATLTRTYAQDLNRGDYPLEYAAT